ncbi:MAG: hypothetical protein A4E35_00516 [Methanoregula sp. PtaU1.Bin051]|nr:MAG: hypothetical protein A4E35_00516 [Methanoregula sp. PtaU1.Bin051]
MMADRIRKIRHDPEAGVSEIVGAIMLISLVVLAVSIIAMILFSQSAPEQIPNVNFMVGSNYPPTTLYLYHNGGDNLRIGSFQVRLDGVSKPYILDGGGQYWTLGRRLNVDLTGITPLPRQVTLVYNTSAGAVAIHSATANLSTGPGNMNPDIMPTYIPSTTCLNPSDPNFPSQIVYQILQNVTVIADAINQSPTTVGPVIATAVSGNSVTFFKDGKVKLDSDNLNTYYFRFKVTKSGSTMSVVGLTPDPYPLYINDIVTIYLRSNSANFKTFGLGDQLWEVSTNGVNVNITRGGVPTVLTNTNFVHAWITGYEDIGSTLKISTTTPSNEGTVLYLNGTQLIDGPNGDAIVITNIRPVGVGLYVLEWDSNAQTIYFVGNAQQVTINGIPVI